MAIPATEVSIQTNLGAHIDHKSFDEQSEQKYQPIIRPISGKSELTIAGVAVAVYVDRFPSIPSPANLVSCVKLFFAHFLSNLNFW